MNTKITFPELINAISIATNTTKRISEIFLKEFFAVITKSLIDGESVKIKRIGTFKLAAVEARKSINVNTGEEIEIPAHNRLVFTPDKELAEAVNMPFSSFETIELSDVIPEADIEKFNDTTSESIDIAIETQSVVADNNINGAESNEDVAQFIEVEQIDDVIPEIEEEPVTEDAIIDNNNPNIPTDVIEEEVIIEEEADVIEKEYIITEELIELTTDNDVKIDEIPEITTLDNPSQEQHCNMSYEIKCSFGKGFFWGFVCALFTSLGIFFFIAQYNGFPIIINNNNEMITDSIDNHIKPQLRVDTVATVLVHKKPEIVIKETARLDTITQKRFLTTLARKYYGDYNFWVYIYAENSDVLGDPNKIKPGTVVVIPSAEKYNIDKNDKNSLNEARKRALAIFKKYE